jgi:hypothetical protein
MPACSTPASTHSTSLVDATDLSRFLRSCYDKSVTTICSVSYWRFISGSGPIECNLGRPEQNGQYMQFVQRRINTGDCASR